MSLVFLSICPMDRLYFEQRVLRVAAAAPAETFLSYMSH